MTPIIALLLGGLTADRPFDTREAAQSRLERLWPLSAPWAVIGCGSNDAEVNYRCRRVLSGHGKGWQLVSWIVTYPGSLAVFADSPPYAATETDLKVMIAMAERMGVAGLNEVYDAYYPPGPAFVLWGRLQAVRKGVKPKDVIGKQGDQIPKPMPPGK